MKRWLKAHPRFHLRFTPTSASWLNMVERFFAEITRNRIRCGAFKSGTCGARSMAAQLAVDTTVEDDRQWPNRGELAEALCPAYAANLTGAHNCIRERRARQK